MSETQTPAPEAGDEVVQAIVEVEATEEVAETPEGEQPDAQDADTSEHPQQAQAEAPQDQQATDTADQSAQLSKSKERRERRKREIDGLREQAQAAEKAAQDAIAAAEKQRDALAQMPVPKLEDFNGDFDRYQASLAAFQTVNIIDEREVSRLSMAAESAKAEAERVRQANKSQLQTNWQEQREEGRTKYDDYDAVVGNEHLQISDDVFDLIASSDVGTDVAYALGKNPEKARELSSLGAQERARAFGRLEALVSAPKPKTVTTAPDPIRPVVGKASPAKDVDRMTPSEYRAWRAEGGTF